MVEAHPIPANPQFKNLTGKRFGRLAVVSFSRREGRKNFWNCRCRCGADRVVRGDHLTTGATSSCGCYLRENRGTFNFRHGLIKQPTYRSWAGMLARCENPNNPRYADWGGRGITVCPRWHSFTLFLADMGIRPSPRHSIDRINNEGNYESGNCRWATQKTQNRNRRNNRHVTIAGQTRTLAEWCEHFGISQHNVKARVRGCGWSLERALTTPLMRRG